jgi:hypothetical protein
MAGHCRPSDAGHARGFTAKMFQMRIGVIADTHGLLRSEAEERLAGVNISFMLATDDAFPIIHVEIANRDR